MMAGSLGDLLGQAVYARDDIIVGRVKELVFEGEYAVVRRSLFSKVVVPVKAIDRSGDRMVIALDSTNLDDAPKVDPKRPLSENDKSLLDEFYMPHAA